jgi:hypothetical protein
MTDEATAFKSSYTTITSELGYTYLTSKYGSLDRNMVEKIDRIQDTYLSLVSDPARVARLDEYVDNEAIENYDSNPDQPSALLDYKIALARAIFDLNESIESGERYIAEAECAIREQLTSIKVNDRLLAKAHDDLKRIMKIYDSLA